MIKKTTPKHDYFTLLEEKIKEYNQTNSKKISFYKEWMFFRHDYIPMITKKQNRQFAFDGAIINHKKNITIGIEVHGGIYSTSRASGHNSYTGILSDMDKANHAAWAKCSVFYIPKQKTDFETQVLILDLFNKIIHYELI